SWNNGTEGETGDRAIVTARFDDRCALLATLFASRGTIMLTAGDEFGRTQRGNNNAYAQDNEITWLDWAGRDQALEQYAVLLATL
ncbi:MAG: glycogen debranching enzyme GlgX, partial [Mesorhizobium sp.]